MIRSVSPTLRGRLSEGVTRKQLFTALADAAMEHMKDFNSQVLASIVWAFAKVGHNDDQLCTALSSAAMSA